MSLFSNLHVVGGLGVTGLSIVRYLQSQAIPVAVTDTRQSPPNIDILKRDFPQVPTYFGKLDEEILGKAAKIILSPGIALREPVIAAQIARGVPVMGDIELFAQAVKVPVIAITGTNAKSTVTTLVGEMAKEAGYHVGVGGNLGIPVLDLLTNEPSAELFVLELSSFQLETTHTLAPRVATVLNVTPDHMDRYDDLHAYQQAKLRVYHHCQVAVCNRDDPLTDCPLQKKIYFTLNKPQQDEFGLLPKDNKVYLAYGDNPLLSIQELPLVGRHSQANALAALAIGYGFGLPFPPMLAVLKKFTGLPHRCQFVRERNGVKWYNDSKGTNVGATLAAIEGLGSQIQGKLILIAGGIGKNADFSPLLPAVERYVRGIVLLGQDAPVLAHVIGQHVPFSFATDMQEAVHKASDMAQRDDSVLLSPACASLDMFKNFEHRGDVFTDIVRGLASESLG
jgi:UDP-N-acetylmuramoylalanine--D-glutamate ligase